MRFKIFLLAFGLLINNSCTSPATVDFKEDIVQKEREAFQIILSKDGLESKKLNLLAKDDFKGALATIDQQAIEFDKIIKSIESLSTEGIKEGGALKSAAIHYYSSLKELHYFDRQEVEQQSLLSKISDRDQKNASGQLMELARQKKVLYKKVCENEQLMRTAIDRFDAANGL